MPGRDGMRREGDRVGCPHVACVQDRGHQKFKTGTSCPKSLTVFVKKTFYQFLKLIYNFSNIRHGVSFHPCSSLTLKC